MCTQSGYVLYKSQNDKPTAQACAGGQARQRRQVHPSSGEGCSIHAPGRCAAQLPLELCILSVLKVFVSDDSAPNTPALMWLEKSPCAHAAAKALELCSYI